MFDARKAAKSLDFEQLVLAHVPAQSQGISGVRVAIVVPLEACQIFSLGIRMPPELINVHYEFSEPWI